MGAGRAVVSEADRPSKGEVGLFVRDTFWLGNTQSLNNCKDGSMCAIVGQNTEPAGPSSPRGQQSIEENMMLVMAHNNKRGDILPTLSGNADTIYRALEDGNVTDHTATANSTIIRLRAVTYLYR